MLRLLQDEGEAKQVIDDTVDDHEDTERNPFIFCCRCDAQLTPAATAVLIADKHEHVFVNPSGILYHIRCFKQVAGCYCHGDWTPEWSWFPDNAWRYAACSGCHTHIGWEYDGGFFGLIAERIYEGEH